VESLWIVTVCDEKQQFTRIHKDERSARNEAARITATHNVKTYVSKAVVSYELVIDEVEIK